MTVQGCPVCGAELGSGKPACWLCRHPLPERVAPAKQVPEPPLPSDPGVERRREDHSELDQTSLCIGIGLVVATVGAFGVAGGAGTAIAIVALLPVLYLGLDFVRTIGSDDAAAAPAAPEPQGTVAKAIKFLAIFVGVVVLVPVAICVALFLACTLIIGGGALLGSHR